MADMNMDEITQMYYSQMETLGKALSDILHKVVSRQDTYLYVHPQGTAIRWGLVNRDIAEAIDQSFRPVLEALGLDVVAPARILLTPLDKYRKRKDEE